jgi:hypothetical protein
MRGIPRGAEESFSLGVKLGGHTCRIAGSRVSVARRLTNIPVPPISPSSETPAKSVGMNA